jgi:hypothetical protein
MGDVVVFHSADPEQAAGGHGHVGIFISQSESSVRVLGANQRNDLGHHAVSEKDIPKKGPFLMLHSFHSIDAFPTVS